MTSDALAERKNTLLVEGTDDKHVARHLLRKYADISGVEIDISSDNIKEHGGFEKLRKKLSTYLGSSSLHAIGIIVDANDNPSGRWQSIRDAVAARGVSLPSSPDTTGTIVSGVSGSSRVGVWMMPDNGLSGELENFVETLIPEDDVVWPLSQQYIDDIPVEHRKFHAGKLLRAQVHAWLATLEEPRKMGAAVGTGDLRIDAPLAGMFIAWLRQLYR